MAWFRTRGKRLGLSLPGESTGARIDAPPLCRGILERTTRWPLQFQVTSLNRYIIKRYAFRSD